MFPAAGAANGNCPEAFTNLGAATWLQNESYTISKDDAKANDVLHLTKKNAKKHKSKKSHRTVADKTKDKKVPIKLPADKIFIEEVAGLTSLNAYRIDSTANVNILKFQSIYEGHVAKHRTRPCVLCSTLRFDYSEKPRLSRKEVLKRFVKQRYYHTKNVAKSRRNGAQVTNASSATGSDRKRSDMIEDFIAVGDDNELLPKTGEEVDAGSPEEPVDGLSVEVEQINKHLRTTPTDVDAWFRLIRLQEKTSRLVMRSVDTIEDILGLNEPRRAQRMTQLVVLEKKLAIFDRAIVENPSDVRLKVARLRLCVDLWEADRLTREWRQLSFVHPNNLDIWAERIRFGVRSFAAFSFAGTLRTFHQCFATVDKLVNGITVSHPLLPGTGERFVAMFWWYTRFLQQAGYTERAVASWQAVLELNWFAPPELCYVAAAVREGLSPAAAHQRLFAAFEAFWESGLPRVGEVGAMGWCNYRGVAAARREELVQTVRAQTRAADQLATDEEASLLCSDESDKHTWRDWLRLESSRESRQWQPRRPTASDGGSHANNSDPDDDECADLDRVVLHDDITGCLVRLRGGEASADNARRHLWRAFLLFCGVSDSVVTEKLEELVDSPAGRCWQPEFDVIRHTSTATNRLFRDFSAFSPVATAAADGLQEFAGRLCGGCSSLVAATGDHTFAGELAQLAMRLLVVGQSSKPSQQRTAAKAILAQPANRNAPLLWLEFACLLWRQGRLSEARTVLDTTLAAAQPLHLAAMMTSSSNNSNSTTLLRTTTLDFIAAYTRLELGVVGIDIDLALSTTNTVLIPPLNTDSRSRVLHVLAYCANGEGRFEALSRTTNTAALTGTALLRLSGLLKTHMDNVCSAAANTATASSDFVRCALILTYLYCVAVLLVRDDPAACADAFDHTLTLFGGGPDVTRVHTRRFAGDFIDLLLWRVRSRCCSVRALMPPLDAALSRFPTDFRLLTQLLRCQLGCQLFASVRLRYCRLALLAASEDAGDHEAATSLIPWLFVLALERLRHAGDGSAAVVTERRLRALYHRLLDDDVGGGCYGDSGSGGGYAAFVPLRRYFVAGFAALATGIDRTVEDEASRRKRLKALCYQALQKAPWCKGLYLDMVTVMESDAEAQEVCDLLAEKELRLRTPLEEIDIVREAAATTVTGATGGAVAESGIPHADSGTTESVTTAAESGIVAELTETADSRSAELTAAAESVLGVEPVFADSGTTEPMSVNDR